MDTKRLEDMLHDTDAREQYWIEAAGRKDDELARLRERCRKLEEALEELSNLAQVNSILRAINADLFNALEQAMEEAIFPSNAISDVYEKCCAAIASSKAATGS